MAARLRAMTEVNSISAEDTFGLQADILEYLADMEQNAEGLGIHKVYASYAAMVADAPAPVGSNGKALRYGQLVSIYDESNPSQSESGNVYAWQKGNTGASAWLLMGNLGELADINWIKGNVGEINSQLSRRYEYSDFVQKKFYVTGDYAIDDVLSDAPPMNYNNSFGCLMLEIASGTRITISTKSGNTGRTYCIVSKDTGMVLAIGSQLNDNLYDNPFTYVAQEDAVAYINDQVSLGMGYVIVTPNVVKEIEGINISIGAMNDNFHSLDDKQIADEESIDLNRENIEALRSGGNYSYRKVINSVSILVQNYIVPGAAVNTSIVQLGVAGSSVRCLAFYPIREGYSYSIHIPKTTNSGGNVWAYISEVLSEPVEVTTNYSGARVDLTTGTQESMDLTIEDATDRYGNYIVVAYNSDYGMPTIIEYKNCVVSPRGADIQELNRQINIIKHGGEVVAERTVTSAYSLPKVFIFPTQNTYTNRVVLKGSSGTNCIGFVEITNNRKYRIQCHGTNIYGLRWAIFNDDVEDLLSNPPSTSTNYDGATLDLTTSDNVDLDYTTPILTNEYGDYLIFSYKSDSPVTITEIEVLEVYKGLDTNEEDIEALGNRVTSLESTPNTKVMEAASYAYRENARLALRPVVILGIGNSWTENAMTYLGNILYNLGITAVMYRSMAGGAPLEKYSNDTISNALEFEVYKRVGDDNNWTTIADADHKMCIRDILALEEVWDIVTFQQRSLYAGDYSTFQPYLNNLLLFEKDRKSIWAKIYFHSTWAYPNGAADSDGTFANLYNSDSDTMYQAVLDAWSNAMEDTGIFNIIPATVAIKECAAIWDAAGNNMMAATYSLYTANGTHLGSAGMYAAALCWAETLIKTFFYPSATHGRTILDCTYEPYNSNVYSTELAAFRSKVSEVVANYKSYYDCFD